MKKQLQVLAVSFASILSVASAHAGMIEAKNGDAVYITYGSNTNGSNNPGAGGGEFLISDLTSGQVGTKYQYIGFCLEKNETVNPAYHYYALDSDTGVAYFAENGGIGGGDGNKDYLSNATKWLMNQYVTNYSSFYNTYGEAKGAGYFAGLMQDAVWYFEDEITGSNSLVTTVYGILGPDAKKYQSNYLTSVKALNIVTTGGDHRQSMVVATPEPATMLLLGTGLAGLVGVMRSRRNKDA